MGEEGGGGRNSGTKRFFSFFFQAWWIREGHGKRRKGGNKSVATNMSVARLFIGARGRTGQACSARTLFSKGGQDVLL